MAEYLANMRKFGLRGYGCTIVTGSAFAMGYIKYQSESQQRRKRKPYTDSETGEKVEFHDESESGLDDYHLLKHCWNSIQSSPFCPSPITMCCVVMGLWGYRCFGSFNRLMAVRYSDIGYQIRRPDHMAEKMYALKHLFLGGLVVPATIVGVGGGWWYYEKRKWETFLEGARGSQQAQNQQPQIAESTSSSLSEEERRRVRMEEVEKISPAAGEALKVMEENDNINDGSSNASSSDNISSSEQLPSGPGQGDNFLGEDGRSMFQNLHTELRDFFTPFIETMGESHFAQFSKNNQVLMH